MINKYRKKFILVTMISLFVVLALLIGLINIINYTKILKDSDKTIEEIHNREGAFNPFEPIPPVPGGEFNPGGIDREERFRTRYFSVVFNNNNEHNVVSVNIDNISLNSEQAIELAKKVVEKGKTKGFYGNYRFIVYDSSDNIEVLFLDCAKERISNQTFLFTSAIISLAGYLVVFGIMVIVSKIVVKPFYENMEKQKKFITDASHELKTPLTIMSADIEVLEIENGENEWLDSMKSQIERLTSMTKNLTLMSKMDEDSTTYELNDFNISNVLNEAIDDVTTLLSTKDKNLIVDVENDVHINGNEELIRTLFMNLLENAYKYSLGNVSVSLKKENKVVLIKFMNEAEVPDGNLDYLFDRFYRMDESHNSKTGGNGIGLSIAKSIVEINHGEINAIGEDNKITFIIKFKA